MIFFAQYPSPIGPLVMTSGGTALTGLFFGTPEPGWEPADNLAIFNSVKEWLDAYFAGADTPADFPLAPGGTGFQRRVWELLTQVPRGETTTYGALAKALGTQMSPQAVGQAVARNPIAIIIPCHRCVGAKGALTGFAWGIERKQWLLTHEEDTK